MSWRLDCGDYTLFVIEDGYYWRDPAVYDERADDYDWRFHPRREDGFARLNFGCYVITDGDHTMMVDAGIGEIDQPEMVAGLMPERFDALGLDRESVELVVYSHMHYDHIGGSQRDGRIVFPNARHLFHNKEWAHWKAVDNEFGKAARRIMEPLFDAGVVDFIERDTEVLPGVRALETFGHTPGHLTVRLESGDTRTVVGGDMSNHPFQVEHPDWSLPVDNDHAVAGTTRDRVFEEIKDTETTYLAGHYPMPGVGHIVTEEGSRVFRPLDVPRAEGEPDVSPDGSWVVTSYLVGSDMTEPVGEATLTIEDGQVGGTTGLNRFRGRLVDNGISDPLAMTRMAGPPELMEQENLLIAHFSAVDEIAVDAGGMELRGDGLTLVKLRRSGTERAQTSSK